MTYLNLRVFALIILLIFSLSTGAVEPSQPARTQKRRIVTKSILATCKKLIGLNPISKVGIEKVTGAKLNLQIENASQYHDIFKATGSSQDWLCIKQGLMDRI